MLFKYISYLELLVQGSGTIFAILVESIMRNNPVNYFKCRQVVQEELPFKVSSFLELWQPFCSAERNHLCNFYRMRYEKTFCEINLNLGHVSGGDVVLMISFLELWHPSFSVEQNHLSLGMGFPTMWYVRLANLQYVKSDQSLC